MIITNKTALKMGGPELIVPALTVGSLRAKLADFPQDAQIYIWDHETRLTHHPELLAPIIALQGWGDDRVTLLQGVPEENEEETLDEAEAWLTKRMNAIGKLVRKPTPFRSWHAPRLDNK